MHTLINRLRGELPFLLAFAIVPLLLFGGVTLGNRTMLPADNLINYQPWAGVAAEFSLTHPEAPHNELLSDLVLENYAWKRFAAQAIEARQIPLWNPYLFGGTPFLATGQHSILYPFSLLFYVLPLAKAYGWFMVLQYLLGGIFAYSLARVLGVNRWGALVAGLIYQNSLFMVVSVVFPMIVAGVIWLPLALLAVELIVRQQPLFGRPASLPWAAVGAGALGMQVLAGHPEVIYYTGLILGGYSLWRLAPSWREWRRLGRPVIFLGLMAGAGLALGGVQLVPLLEVVTQNFRTGSATLAEVRGWGYPTRRILTFVMPNFFGNPSHHSYFDLFTGQRTLVSVNSLGEPIQKIDWGIKNYVEGGAYVGILPLVLSGLGLWGWLRHRKSNVRLNSPALPFFALLGLLSLAFAFGTPLYALIYYLPGLDQLHSPFRWVWPLSLCVALLAGAGITALPDLNRRLVRSIGGLMAVAGAGGWLVIAGVWIFYDRLAPQIEQALAELALAPNAFSDGRMFFSYEAQWAALFGLWLLLGGGVLWWVGRQRWQPLIALLVGADLLVAGWGFTPSVDTALLGYTPPVIEFLQQDESNWRFTTYSPNGQKTLNANTGWFFDLYDVRGYDSIILKQYADYMTLIEPQNELQFNRIAPLTRPESLDSPLLDLLNVKYIVTEAVIDSPKYQLAYEDDALRVYENLGVMPRAFGLPLGCGLQTSDFAAAVQEYDPRRYIMLEGEATTPGLGPEDCTPIEARITLSEFNTVVIDIDFAEPGYLLLADTYFQGWKAFVRPWGTVESEEQQLELLRANGNFRAVYLEAGNHTVRFRYSPDSLKLGGLLSGLSGLTLVLLAGFWVWRLAYHEGAMDSVARTIAKNSLAPMALNLMNRGVDFLFAAFYLRVLGPGDAGNYTTAIVIIGWFDIWINFGLNTWLTREVSRDHASGPRHLSNTTLFRLILGGVTLPVFLGTLWFYQNTTGGLGDDTLLAILLLAVGMLPSSISAGLTALFYAYEKAEYPAALSSLTTILKVALGTGALVLGYGFVGLAGVSIVVNAVTMAILGVLVWRFFFRPQFFFDPALQRHMAEDSFPLMINHLLATIFFKSDVPMIRGMRGDVEVGQYGTAYKFIDAYNIIPAFFTFALFPVMARQAREDRAELARNYHFALKLLVGIAVPLAVVTTLLAHQMILLLGGEEFLPAGAIALQLMVWSIPFGWINSVTNYLLISLDQQRKLTRAFIVGVTFNIVTNAIFIPIYGFAAAAITTILSEIVEGGVFQFYVHHYLGPVPWRRLFARIVLAGLAMAGTTWLGAQVHLLLGLVLGIPVYLWLVVGLQVFDAAERETLFSLLPGEVQTRLRRMSERWKQRWNSGV